jgi:protein-disulfide isomerase
MHDGLFAQQNRLSVPDLRALAGQLGLDQPRFDECLVTGKLESQWRTSSAEGTAYGVTGTPAFFVNGRFVSGAVSLESFAAIIDEELGRIEQARRTNVVP